MTARVRAVGVVGTGLIAQVMHLHYLAELSDGYEIAAVCDSRPTARGRAPSGTAFPRPSPSGSDLLAHPA